MTRGGLSLAGVFVGTTAAFCLLVVHSWAATKTTVAGGRAGHRLDTFASMDTDGDGRVSEAEHAAAARKMFATMDANGDGSVTATEMEAARGKVSGRKAVKGELTAAEKISAVDTNGDGLLSAEEHEAGSKIMFERMDIDHDGYLTAAEFEAGQALLTHKPAPAK
jgi:hypothetical protein